MTRPQTRIVVTGLGIVSPIGLNVPDFRQSLFAGESGIKPVTRYDDRIADLRVAAEIQDFNERDHFSEKALVLMDRFAQFAVVSAREAVADSGLDFKDQAEHKYTLGSLGQRTAVVHGTGIGGQDTQDENYRKLCEGAKRTHPFTIPKLMPNAGASQISMEFGITGPSLTTATACASTAHAMAMAMLLLRSGQIHAWSCPRRRRRPGIHRHHPRHPGTNRPGHHELPGTGSEMRSGLRTQ